ncbi:peptidase S8/S53 domain-containing protein [Trichophaea hybrida]|nr:peptidase S8/S53 domain-containing protein [Trichophaea hybrida]
MASIPTVQREVIPNHYIVVFKQNTPHETCHAHCVRAHELHSQSVGALSVDEREQYAGIKHEYRFENGWAGYAGSFHADTMKQLEDSDEVDYVEEDIKVYASSTVTDKAGSWGLARISHRDTLTQDNKNTYVYDSSAGKGTRAYIVDTGINVNHQEFQGRAVWGINKAQNSSDTDLQGHGTHVAGTVGGKTYGVAKKTTLIGVKVLGDDGTGNLSDVIAGLEWAVNDAQRFGMNKSVANMSLGGGYAKSINDAVKAAVGAGLTVCVAAGNDHLDAAKSSPASEPTAITVGSIDIDDTVSYYSNWGRSVDIWAPGRDITSAWIGGTTNTNTISGTSMATPHITGICLYLIAFEGLSSPQAIRKRLNELGESNSVQQFKGQGPNLLAQNGEGA